MSPPSARSAPGTSPASGRRTAPGSRAVPGGQAPAATVQFLLVTYAKRGRMRFASHRDVGRAFERAVRQAGVPIARSAGFNPHPKISYASGTQTGVASEAEYLTLALTAAQDPERLRSALDTALPDGIDVIEVRQDSGGTLNGRLMVSEWLVELPGISPEAAVAAAREFLASAEAHVERLTNKGVRRLDARGAVLTMDAGPRACDDRSDKCAIIRMVVRHTEPAVRPEDVLAALRQIAGLAPASSPAVTRVAQGVLGDDGLVGPEQPPAMAAHAGSPDRGSPARAPQTHELPAHELPAHELPAHELPAHELPAQAWSAQAWPAQAPHAQVPHDEAPGAPHDEAPGAPHQAPTRAPEQMDVP